MITRNSGLPERLASHLEDSRTSGKPVAVVCVGLQGLRRIRIRAGYAAMDELLARAAERVREVLRPGDELLELGSGDFALILPSLRDGSHAMLAASRLLHQFETPIQADGQPVLASVAVGIAVYPEHGEEAELLCRQAEQAMLEARRQPDHMLLGGTPVKSPSVDPAELLEAINGGQLSMHLQPILDVRQRKVVGAEALARWHHPEKGAVSPGVFIPVAESSGMISQFTRWSMNACLQVIAEARDAGISLPVSMNLSATAFAERGLVEQLLGGLKLWGVESKELILEVTETAIVTDIQRGAAQLRQLNAAGIRVSIDDFGVGNASVAYLQQFPATEMKIDQSFVTGMLGDLRSLQMVKAMLAFARQMGMRVVAEGVEDEDTLQALGDLGCNLVQGWAVGKPQPASELIAELARSRR